MDTILLRSGNHEDFETILRLNEEEVQYTAPMDLELLENIFESSDFCHVAEINKKVVAFVLALREGTTYDSVNYKWFSEHYEKFLYVDRIVVSGEHKGKKIGSMLYEKTLEYGKTSGVLMVAAEINIEPPNLTSLKFHKKFGFSEVGQLSSDDKHKIVSLQVSTL